MFEIPDASSASPEPLTVTEVRAALQAVGVVDVEWYSELESTNDHALRICALDQLALPRVIWAEQQTRGRGRGDHAWWSQAGALTFSLVVDLHALELPPEKWSALSLVTGIAVADVLSDLAPRVPVGIKWPNDIQFDGRKICGILTEVPDASRGRAVIGIGINVGNSAKLAPAELSAQMTSLQDCLPWCSYSPADVLVPVVVHWLQCLTRYCRGTFPLPEVWRKYCVLTGEQVRQTGHGHGSHHASLTGQCLGIDTDGALLIEQQGEIYRLIGGSVVGAADSQRAELR